MQTVFNSTLYMLRHLVIRNAISIHNLFYLYKIRSTLAGTLNLLVQTLNFLHLASTSSDCYGPNICPRTWNFIRPQKPPSSGGATFYQGYLLRSSICVLTYLFTSLSLIYMFIYIYIWKNFLFIVFFRLDWNRWSAQHNCLLFVCNMVLSVRLSRYSIYDYKHS